LPSIKINSPSPPLILRPRSPSPCQMIVPLASRCRQDRCRHQHRADARPRGGVRGNAGVGADRRLDRTGDSVVGEKLLVIGTARRSTIKMRRRLRSWRRSAKSFAARAGGRLPTRRRRIAALKRSSVMRSKSPRIATNIATKVSVRGGETARPRSCRWRNRSHLKTDRIDLMQI
jgi:hypothetical protein